MYKVQEAAKETVIKIPGGNHMDMFKDKLVRKMTAQEIIKANTEADTKELNTLKAQVAG